MRLKVPNGIINADQGALVEAPFIGKVEATVLDNTPAALSLGTLIMDEGYDWLWTRKNRNHPISIDPDYQAVIVDVENKYRCSIALHVGHFKSCNLH